MGRETGAQFAMRERRQDELVAIRREELRLAKEMHILEVMPVSYGWYAGQVYRRPSWEREGLRSRTSSSIGTVGPLPHKSLKLVVLECR